MKHTFYWVIHINPERLQVLRWCERMARILPGLENTKRYSAIKGGGKR